jgi:hypothetical protein
VPVPLRAGDQVIIAGARPTTKRLPGYIRGGRFDHSTFNIPLPLLKFADAHHALEHFDMKFFGDFHGTVYSYILVE